MTGGDFFICFSIKKLDQFFDWKSLIGGKNDLEE